MMAPLADVSTETSAGVMPAGTIAAPAGAETAVGVTPGGAGSLPLIADRVSKSYGHSGAGLNEVIGEISFSLAKGEIVSLVGPSGCGKTTLLNMLSGLSPPTRGNVLWHGKVLSDVPKGIGYMLQKDMLMSWRTALANVTLGLELSGMGKGHREKKAHQMLGKVGLAQYYDHYPNALSGGMRQRVALARTLVTEPELLLLDEPFAALDFQTKMVLESDMTKLVRSEGRSVLLITHDVEEAVSISDRVIVLTHRPSRIKTIHTIDLPGDRDDLMAVRESPAFTAYVRRIWSELDVRMGER
jgi:NitT/TauT family transport system ATP-binding protein